MHKYPGRIMLHKTMIRPARPDEGAALTTLARRSKAYWGYDDAFMHAHHQALSVDAAYIADNPTYLAENPGVAGAGAIVGFYALEHVQPGLVELGFMFVEPACIGQGIGRQLLSHASVIAGQLGYAEIRIVSDPHATGFYRQMGAEPWGEWHSPTIPGRRLPVLHLCCSIPDPTSLAKSR